MKEKKVAVKSEVSQAVSRVFHFVRGHFDDTGNNRRPLGGNCFSSAMGGEDLLEKEGRHCISVGEWKKTWHYNQYEE